MKRKMSESTTAATLPVTGQEGMEGLLRRPLSVDASEPGMAGVRIGRVAAAGGAGFAVLLPHCAEPLPAQALCALGPEDVGRPCAVLFVEGDPSRPLVVGCVVEDAPLVETQELAPPARPFASDDDREVVVDGELVRIEARSELELRCGESVILLLRDGRIEIRGNYVTSQATATQRIRGGSVHIN